MMVADDPFFEERMRITAKVVGDELTRLAGPIEPKLREGLTKSIARRFSREQLGPIATFFETDAGKAYAAQSMSLFIDKDVMLAMMSSVPSVIKEMPGINSIPYHVYEGFNFERKDHYSQWKPGDFTLHLPGMTNAERIPILEDYSKLIIR